MDEELIKRTTVKDDGTTENPAIFNDKPVDDSYRVQGYMYMVNRIFLESGNNLELRKVFIDMGIN